MIRAIIYAMLALAVPVGCALALIEKAERIAMESRHEP